MARETSGSTRVLLVDDSPTVRMIVRGILSIEPGFTVVGEAENGERGVAMTKALLPDVIVMDINMPVMGGQEATEQIMAEVATPIVAFSSLTLSGEARASIDVLAAGAVDVMGKPDLSDEAEVTRCASALRRKLKIASKVAVVRHLRGRTSSPDKAAKGSSVASTGDVHALDWGKKATLVAIGSSAGGPLALRNFLSGLGSDFPLPILLVQHMTTGFTQGFADWLSDGSPLPVVLASHGDRVVPGRVLVAPDARQMELNKDGTVSTASDVPCGGHLPSVDVLFESVADVVGASAVGIILTGMGADGVDGMLKMRKAGALTLAQNRETSAVFGMPGEAMKRGAAERALSPQRIAALLCSLAKEGPAGNRFSRGVAR